MKSAELVTQFLVAAACLSLPKSAFAQSPRLSEATWESYHEMDVQGPGTYAFGYDIEDPSSGNVQFRQEERHPNNTVTGSYGILAPDGAVRVIYYTADHNGYRVTMETSHQVEGYHSTETNHVTSRLSSSSSIAKGKFLLENESVIENQIK